MADDSEELGREPEHDGLLRALSERDDLIAQLEATVEERSERITIVRQALKNRDTRIGALEEAVAARDRRIGDLDRGIEARDARIKQLDDAVAHRDNRIEQLDAAVSDRDSKIRSLESGVGSQRAAVDDVAAMERRLSELSNERDGSRAESVRLRGELNRLRRSVVVVSIVCAILAVALLAQLLS